jgi:hypothetical protein
VMSEGVCVCERCTQGKEKSPPSLYIWHAPSIIIVSLTALGGERYMHRTIGVAVTFRGHSVCVEVDAREPHSGDIQGTFRVI